MCVLMTDPGPVCASLMRTAPAGRLSAWLLWSAARGHGITALTHCANGASSQVDASTCLKAHLCCSHTKHECKSKKYTYKRTLNLRQGHGLMSSPVCQALSSGFVCYRAGLGRLSLRLDDEVSAKEGSERKVQSSALTHSPTLETNGL